MLRLTLKKILVPILSFMLGSVLIASFYLGLLTWLQGWEYATAQLMRDRWYVLPIIIGFGIQAALYMILRLRLFVPTSTTHGAGTMVGASGGTSATAMVACCLHHAADVLPVLGISAAASFLTQYQRPFMLLGLMMNFAGIILMLIVLLREKRKLQLVIEKQ